MATTHAFCDDALADHDAVALAALIRSGELSRDEVLAATFARLELVGDLDAVEALDRAGADRRRRTPVTGVFDGVTTLIKDNTDLAGTPSGQGSEAIDPQPVKKDSGFTQRILGTGLNAVGKSRLPEFGFNASTEFMTREPVHNPWDPRYSPGASSGGSAALVAAGVVPIAHANDGGGSIRIPAAACGLVGLKPTRGRFPFSPLDRLMPICLAVEGVVTRSVRDTAHFFAATEWARPRRPLPPIGLVAGPGSKRLRIGLVLDTVTDAATVDAETKDAVSSTATLLESLGHEVVEMTPPMDQQFADDFLLYWAMLASAATAIGPRLFPGFDRSKRDGLTIGLADHFRRNRRALPGAIRRLRRSPAVFAETIQGYDAVLSPVLAHTTPELGYLSPRQPFDQLISRLLGYVAFTPLNNATGSPAISLPMGRTAQGLPIGVQLMAGDGQERVLLELAYELEAAQPFRRIQD